MDNQLHNKIDEQIDNARVKKQEAQDTNSRSITMYTKTFDAQKNLKRPVKVQAKLEDQEEGISLFADRTPFERLNRSGEEITKEEFKESLDKEDDEDEEEEAKVNIEQVSREVYNKLRERLALEFERGRARMA